MPSSRDTSRSESAAAPSRSMRPRATSLTSRVSSARAFSRAVRGAFCLAVGGAFTAPMLRGGEHCTQVRRVLLTFLGRVRNTVRIGEHLYRPLSPGGIPMALHVIVGHGPVGRLAAGLLLEQGHEVRVITRSGGPADSPVRHVSLDASDAEALTRAARGAAVLYNC